MLAKIRGEYPRDGHEGVLRLWLVLEHLGLATSEVDTRLKQGNKVRRVDFASRGFDSSQGYAASSVNAQFLSMTLGCPVESFEPVVQPSRMCTRPLRSADHP
jgi:hypothetical protein